MTVKSAAKTTKPKRTIKPKVVEVKKEEEKAVKEEVRAKKIDIDKIKKGELLCFTYYVEVANANPPWQRMNTTIQVDNLYSEKPQRITVEGASLIENCFSADQFESEVICNSKNEVAEKLIHSGIKVFTIHYRKRDKEMRTLRGKYAGQDGVMGQSWVEDLEIPFGENRIRLVDHRDIHWIIIGGVKYIYKNFK